ncbi:metallophosphatase family protein [Flavobacteriaceae bacterium]|nr:metallophosphatase family protein [Flavobacteriaceae bacterium]MDC3238270.1 metallophosphatase family protein [Flavobacteriaceae bacterium]
MKKILLLSDTHSHLDHKIIKYIDDADEVWHAGDIGTTTVADGISRLKTLKGVYGNIDGHQLRSQFPENQIFSCEGVKVLMTHIGGYPGRYNARVKKLILTEKPQLYICGHSHILKVIQDRKNNLLHMNPGACGIQGFHKIRTLLRFELNDGKIEKLEAIELGLRGSLIASDQ